MGFSATGRQRPIGGGVRTRKVLLVTGASRGFGGLIAQRALAAGHSVVPTGRNPRTLIDLFGNHPGALPLALDVTDETQAHAAAMATIQRFGHIDVLINGAGHVLRGAVEEASATEIETLYRTNVFGLLAVTRAVLPSMRRRRSGHIINISSVDGYVGRAGLGVYCSTKFAVEGLSEALAVELQPLGIHVTVVAPGDFCAALTDPRSATVSARRIDHYHGVSDRIAGQVSRGVSDGPRTASIGPNNAQPGASAKFADAVISLIEQPNPPIRLPLGDDALAAIETKSVRIGELLERLRSVSTSTDRNRG